MATLYRAGTFKSVSLVVQGVVISSLFLTEVGVVFYSFPMWGPMTLVVIAPQYKCSLVYLPVSSCLIRVVGG